MTMEWTDELKTGDEKVDSQHSELISYINRLSETVDSPAGVDLGDIREAIDKLTKYTKEHFDYEEAYMVKEKFSDIRQHKKTHDQFRKIIDGFQEKFYDIYRNDSLSGNELQKLLKDLIKHIEGNYFKHILHAKSHHKKH